MVEVKNDYNHIEGPNQAKNQNERVIVSLNLEPLLKKWFFAEASHVILHAFVQILDLSDRQKFAIDGKTAVDNFLLCNVKVESIVKIYVIPKILKA